MKGQSGAAAAPANAAVQHALYTFCGWGNPGANRGKF